MYHEEKTFAFRFSLEATFPDEYEGDEDNYAWLQDWEKRIKPELLHVLFTSLRQNTSWAAHVRNRGMSPEAEIEVVMTKDFAKDGHKPPRL